MTRWSQPLIHTTRVFNQHLEERIVRRTETSTGTTKAGYRQRTARVEPAVARFVFFFTLIHECAFNYFPTWLGFLTIFFRLHLINQFYDFCCSTDNELYDFEVFDYQVDLCRSFTKTTFNFNFKIFFSSEW